MPFAPQSATGRRSRKPRSPWPYRQRSKSNRSVNCHPERSEGSASCGELQIRRFATDDKLLVTEQIFMMTSLLSQDRFSYRRKLLRIRPVTPEFSHLLLQHMKRRLVNFGSRSRNSIF